MSSSNLSKKNWKKLKKVLKKSKSRMSLPVLIVTSVVIQWSLLGDAGSKLFVMDFSFLGINLANIPKWNFWTAGFSWASIGLFLLPLVSVGISLLSMQVSLNTNQMNNQAQDETMAKTNRTMMIMMPLMSLWIGFTVPAGLSVYWIAQYIFTIFQEIICGKLLKKDYPLSTFKSIS